MKQYVSSAYRVLKKGGSASLYFPESNRRPGVSSVASQQTSGIIWEHMVKQDALDMMSDAGFVDIRDPLPDMNDLMLIGKKV